MRLYLHSAVQALFERGGARKIFEHVRDLLVSTVVVAAGLDTAKRNDTGVLHTFLNPVLLSYVIVTVGLLLIAINFFDGLRRLKRFRWHVLLQFGLGITYVLVSFRIVQVVVFYRTHGC